MPFPSLIALFILAGSLVMIAAVTFGLDRALARAGWQVPDRKAAVRTALLFLLAWFAAAIVLSIAGVYSASASAIPTIQYGIFVPILAGSYALFRSGAAGRVLAAVPMNWLVGVQLYRIMGGVFLVLWFAGSLPALFALPAGIGDIAVGLAAPAVAAFYARDALSGRGAVAWWNAFGVLDLVVAVGTGLLTSPSVLQAFAFDRPNILIAEFPLIFIPTFLVPLSILLHVAVWLKLSRERAPSAVYG